MRALARLAPGVVLLALCLLHVAAHALDIVVQDDRGEEIRLPQAARRVVTLAPDLAEIVALIGAPQRLVGVARGSDYPASLRRVPQIGDASGIDFERILALRPDLVLAWGSGNRAADIQRLEKLGYPVFVTETATLDAIPRALRRIGRLLGAEAEAQRQAAEYESHLKRLSRHFVDGRPKVFVEIWDAPLMTVNGAHLISDVVQRCGGRNIFADLPVLAGSVSMETVLIRAPDLIIAALPAGREPQRAWQRWPGLRAVARHHAVHRIDPDLLSRATPRILSGMEQICGWIDAARP